MVRQHDVPFDLGPKGRCRFEFTLRYCGFEKFTAQFVFENFGAVQPMLHVPVLNEHAGFVPFSERLQLLIA
jgi:hypothetical protein